MSKALTPEQIARKGKELEEAKWELPEKYRLTPKMLAKADEEQARLAAQANAAFGTASPQEMERARSVVIAQALSRSLDGVRAKMKVAVVSGGENLETLRTAERELRHQLAERYAVYGRYDLAAEIEPLHEYAELYGKMLEAIWRDDDEWCDCGDHLGSGAFTDLTVPQMFVKEEVFSIKLGKPAFLLACARCRTWNVVEHLPPSLRKAKELRARARQLVDGLSPAQAAQVLTQHGHTSNLLKSK